MVKRLTEEARQNGLTLDAYLLQVVSLHKPSQETTLNEAEQRKKREEAAASIRNLRKGNILGPDLTIRDLIEEGRRF